MTARRRNRRDLTGLSLAVDGPRAVVQKYADAYKAYALRIPGITTALEHSLHSRSWCQSAHISSKQFVKPGPFQFMGDSV